MKLLSTVTQPEPTYTHAQAATWGASDPCVIDWVLTSTETWGSHVSPSLVFNPSDPASVGSTFTFTATASFSGIPAPHTPAASTEHTQMFSITVDPPCTVTAFAATTTFSDLRYVIGTDGTLSFPFAFATTPVTCFGLTTTYSVEDVANGRATPSWATINGNNLEINTANAGDAGSFLQMELVATLQTLPVMTAFFSFQVGLYATECVNTAFDV